MKTVKFTEVVKHCDEPSIYLAWVDPARDKTLKRALAAHRVMTLHQELHGGKKDFGSVGFLKDRHAQLLVFPKSLRRFSERKVIAIDYSLIAKDQLSSDSVASQKSKQESHPVSSERSVQAPRVQRPKGSSQKNKVSSPSKPTTAKDVSSPKTGLAETGKILAEVKRAVAELAAGKSVPAYDRLKRLLEGARS